MVAIDLSKEASYPSCKTMSAYKLGFDKAGVKGSKIDF